MVPPFNALLCSMTIDLVSSRTFGGTIAFRLERERGRERERETFIAPLASKTALI